MTDKIEAIRERLAYELQHPSACYELANDVRTLLSELDAANDKIEELRDALRLERFEHQDLFKMAMAMDKEMGADAKTIAALRDSLRRARWAHEWRKAQSDGWRAATESFVENDRRQHHTTGRLVDWLNNHYNGGLEEDIDKIMEELGLDVEDAIGGDE